MNKTDIKQTQIHNTKKDEKPRKLKVKLGNSKDEVTETKKTEGENEGCHCHEANAWSNSKRNASPCQRLYC